MTYTNTQENIILWQRERETFPGLWAPNLEIHIIAILVSAKVQNVHGNHHRCDTLIPTQCIWPFPRRCSRPAIHICYQIIAKVVNKTTPTPWKQPYIMANKTIIIDIELSPHIAGRRNT